MAELFDFDFAELFDLTELERTDLAALAVSDLVDKAQEGFKEHYRPGYYYPRCLNPIFQKIFAPS